MPSIKQLQDELKKLGVKGLTGKTKAQLQVMLLTAKSKKNRRVSILNPKSISKAGLAGTLGSTGMVFPTVSLLPAPTSSSRSFTPPPSYASTQSVGQASVAESGNSRFSIPNDNPQIGSAEQLAALAQELANQYMASMRPITPALSTASENITTERPSQESIFTPLMAQVPPPVEEVSPVLSEREQAVNKFDTLDYATKLSIWNLMGKRSPTLNKNNWSSIMRNFPEGAGWERVKERLGIPKKARSMKFSARLGSTNPPAYQAEMVAEDNPLIYRGYENLPEDIQRNIMKYLSKEDQLKMFEVGNIVRPVNPTLPKSGIFQEERPERNIRPGVQISEKAKELPYDVVRNILDMAPSDTLQIENDHEFNIFKDFVLNNDDYEAEGQYDYGRVDALYLIAEKVNDAIRKRKRDVEIDLPVIPNYYHGDTVEAQLNLLENTYKNVLHKKPFSMLQEMYSETSYAPFEERRTMEQKVSREARSAEAQRRRDMTRADAVPMFDVKITRERANPISFRGELDERFNDDEDVEQHFRAISEQDTLEKDDLDDLIDLRNAFAKYSAANQKYYPQDMDNKGINSKPLISELSSVINTIKRHRFFDEEMGERRYRNVDGIERIIERILTAKDEMNDIIPYKVKISMRGNQGAPQARQYFNALFNAISKSDGY